ncbi:hypothetical protein WJT86_04905 [Microvirga sp. W0021]|uniref:DUF2267 domain-containing protein n=1 Tax=Hohaiivirga grylli TaxID=3133970 RepID=A0ABV0BHG1_9HYPH
MEELVTRIAQAANISPETAQNALGLILSFIEKQAPEQAQALFSYIPGAEQLIANASQEASGGLSGMLGGLLNNIGGSTGNLMALGTQLLGEGLSMEQAKTVATEVIEFGKQQLGEERVAELTKAIPGLSSLL